HGELEGDAAGIMDAVAYPLGQFEMMAIAGRQVGAGLRDADNRLAGGELPAREAIVEKSLAVERGESGDVRVVEPQLRGEAPRGGALTMGRHRSLRAGEFQSLCCLGVYIARCMQAATCTRPPAAAPRRCGRGSAASRQSVR